MLSKDKYMNFKLAQEPVYSPRSVDRQCFENYFYKYFIKNKSKFPQDLEYISVFWRPYEYNRSRRLVPSHLQETINNLDNNKRYFTVCSSPMGISASLPKDTIVFSAASSPTNPANFEKRSLQSCWKNLEDEIKVIPIPLLKHPHEVAPKIKKDIVCSFVGAVDPHECRTSLQKEIEGDGKISFSETMWLPQYSVSQYQKFLDIVSRSTFSLCPRGYGPTSYRLYESFQLGCVPVYIYDTPFLPYQDEIDWNDICLMLPINKIDDLLGIIKLQSPEDAKEYSKNIAAIYHKYFTKQAVCEYILRKLSS